MDSPLVLYGFFTTAVDFVRILFWFCTTSFLASPGFVWL